MQDRNNQQRQGGGNTALAAPRSGAGMLARKSAQVADHVRNLEIFEWLGIMQMLSAIRGGQRRSQAVSLLLLVMKNLTGVVGGRVSYRERGNWRPNKESWAPYAMEVMVPGEGKYASPPFWGEAEGSFDDSFVYEKGVSVEDPRFRIWGSDEKTLGKLKDSLRLIDQLPLGWRMGETVYQDDSPLILQGALQLCKDILLPLYSDDMCDPHMVTVVRTPMSDEQLEDFRRDHMGGAPVYVGERNAVIQLGRAQRLAAEREADGGAGATEGGDEDGTEVGEPSEGEPQGDPARRPPARPAPVAQAPSARKARAPKKASPKVGDVDKNAEALAKAQHKLSERTSREDARINELKGMSQDDLLATCLASGVPGANLRWSAETLLRKLADKENLKDALKRADAQGNN